MSKNKYKIYNKKKLQGCIDERQRKFELPKKLKPEPILSEDGLCRIESNVGTFGGPFFDNTNVLYKHVNNKYKKNYDNINWNQEYSSKEIKNQEYKNKKIYKYK